MIRTDGFSASRPGITIRVLLTITLLLSFVTFAGAAPERGYALGGISRAGTAGPITIGDTIDYTVTITVDPGETLYGAYLIDTLSWGGTQYVPGSATLADVSGNPVTRAAFATTSEPDRVGPHTETQFVWYFATIDNNTPLNGSGEPYVFTLSYSVQVTGVRDNGKIDRFPPGPSQGINSQSLLIWSLVDPPLTDQSMYSNTARTLVDQPLLTVTKWAEYAEVPLGGRADFRVVITNTGWSEAYDIVLRDDYLNGFGDDPELLSIDHSTDGDIIDHVTTASGAGGWIEYRMNDHSLAPGESITIWLRLELDSAVGVGDTVTNIADADWSSLPGEVYGERIYDDNTWEDYYDDSAQVDLTVVNGPYIRVTKAVDGLFDPVTTVGGTIPFVITLENTGNQAASEIPLTDEYDPSMLSFVSASVPPDDPTDDGMLAWNDVTGGLGLAPGATMTVHLTFVARNTPGYTLNAAGAWGPLAGTAFFGSEDVAQVFVYDPAGITWSKDASPPAGTVLLPGQVIRYHDFGENATGYFLPTPLVIDRLPDSVDYVPGTLQAVVPSYGVMEFTDTMFDPSDPDTLDDEGWYDPATRTVYFVSPWGAPQGMFADMYFDVRVRDLTYSAAGVSNQAGLVINPSSLTSAPTIMSNSVYHPVDPITITKTATDVNGGKLAPGDEILWTITVRNIGLSPTTNVIVTDTIPANTTYVAGSITGTGASDVTTPALRWNVGVLAIDQSATLTFRSRVNDNVPAGTTISNQATVDSDQSNARASDSPTTTIRGDATLLQTGGREIAMLLVGLLIALTGVVLVQRGRVMMVRG